MQHFSFSPCASGTLDRIGGLVKWYRFEKLLAVFNHGGAGHPAWPAQDLLERLFTELDGQLEKAGVMVRRGTMLDATLIDAVSKPGAGQGGQGSVDPDARFGGARR
jgi:hypothetical protein